MIIRKHRAFFIHIPKTAGTSIKKTLSASTFGHFNSEKMQNQYPNQWKDFFKFSFVRNPWDRVASIFHYYKYYKHPLHQKIQKEMENMSFSEFCENLCGANPMYWLTGVFSHPRWCNQYEWLVINDQIAVDFIGKYENLQKDFEHVCQKVKAASKNLMHARKSTNKNYKDFYNSHTKKLIRDKFHKDIDYFKYTF